MATSNRPTTGKDLATPGIPAVMRNELRERLRLFNEKAEKLLGLSLADSAFADHAGFTFSWKAGEPLQAARSGPSDEAIDAFVLTLRFFLQDGDGISFRQMAEVYADRSVPGEMARHYHHARATLRSFLGGAGILRLNDEPISRQTLLDVFLYGGLSHASPTKRAIYDSWRARPVAFVILQNEFVITVAELCNCIAYVRDLNCELLDALDTAGR